MIGDEKGSVSIIAASIMSIVLLSGALSIDLSSLYYQKLRLQRVTDLAAFAGATQPDAVVDRRISAGALAVARSVLSLNQIDDRTMQASLETNERGEDIFVVSANEPVPLLFGRLLTSKTSVEVKTVSGVRVGSGKNRGECLRSMAGPINIYGTAKVIGPGCTVGAATYLHLCGTAELEAEQISVKTSAASERAQICGGTKLAPPLPAFGYGVTSEDPYAGDPRIQAIGMRLRRMRSPGWPYGSASPGVPVNRSPSASSNHLVASNQTLGWAASMSYGSLQATSSTVTFQGGGSDPDCNRPTTFAGPVTLAGRTSLNLPAGCYVFASAFTVADGANVTVATGSGAASQPNAVTLVFNGTITNAGAIEFGSAKVTIKGSVNNVNGKRLRFGAGDLVMAGGSISNGAGIFEKGDGASYLKGGSVSNGAGALTFGTGAFYLWGGSFSNASTGTVRFGDGPFIFYGGTLTNVSGDMTFGRGPFEFYGGSLSLNRDSETTFGAGDMNFYGGSVSFGGKKVVFGNGGDAFKGGSSIFMSGGTLSLPASSIEAEGTTFAFDGGTISLYGAGKINTTAPTGASPTFGYRDVLFVVYGGAFNLYGGGAEPNTMSGLIYVPRTNVSIYGRQTINRPAGGCLQILGGVVDIYQNARLDMTACEQNRGASSPRPVLVR